jgi:hypothetical protein
MNSHANDRWLGVVIAAASFLLFAYYSVVTPIFEASDELWHYPMVMRLATGGGLPEQRAGQTDEEAPWRQEGSQPPLYYAAAAALTAPLDHSNWRELRRINPHADMGVPTRDGNANAVMHDAAEAFPWAGAALAVHAARLLSALFSAGAVWFAWMAAREIWPTASAARRAAVPLFVACVPMFAFISGSINNDNAAVFFASGGFWWALREMRRAKFSLRSAVIAGIFAGCGALSKSSTLGLLGLYGLAALLTLRDLRGVAVRARWLVVIVVVTVAVSGWWFARNVMLYGDLLGWNAFLDVVGRRDAPATLAQLWTEREGFVWAYWGVFGTMNVIYPEWLPGLRAYHVLDAMTIVALVGAAWGAVRAVRARRIDWRAAALCAAWIAAIFVALLRWTALTPASQGRLMFPAIGAIACVFVYGLAQIHRAAPWIAGGGLAALAIWTPVGVIAPTYAAPPNQWATSPSDATSQAESLPTLARFGDALDLHAFSYDAGEVRPGDEATLALTWTLDAPLPFDASVFVHLIDENDVIVAQRDMRPGQGSLSTARMFTPYRWSDRYTVRVPRMAPGSRALRWVVGVYDYAGGARLRTEADDDRVVLAAGPALGEPRARGLLRYDDGVRLQAMRGARTRVRPGDAVMVETEWTAPAGARDDNISLQIIDDAGNKIAQQDLGASFSQAAADGGPLVLRHTLAVSPDAAPGSYRLLLVRYTPAGDFPKSPAYDAVSDQYVGEQVVVTGMRAESR